MTRAGDRAHYDLTTDTPLLTLLGEPWSIFCDHFRAHEKKIVRTVKNKFLCSNLNQRLVINTVNGFIVFIFMCSLTEITYRAIHNNNK